ncbi:low molecular weight protein-tyrosine-phosphatase [Pseudoxanthomonas suwonensis]|uniref:low molecular weight protein-tyrosine-phosphatase n=1 Tax=Pseudoxanthomonas suwonensis TaxID=314722 RepID=UPI00138F619A|nr:low molecular weight protein-tyrosine-phosphatase [Pseudoxanthomonas suwonensis]KAF1699989.1 phosphotyrosine protein phosphatase [Pseudoxanthomonas suwonensis]
MFRKILFVCVGNICRSPTAELLMRRRLQGRSNVEVSSAGLQALVGRPVDPQAATLLRENGIDPDSHVARQATPSVLVAADLVLVMEQSHHARIVREVPQVSGKTFLLGKWRGQQEIPDPYRQHREAFQHVYRLIDDCVDSWVPYIK